MTLLFSAISLVAGMIIAYNALLLASDERRRFIVNLIQQGTPEWMIVASLVFDALMLGLSDRRSGWLSGEPLDASLPFVPGYSRPRSRSAANASRGVQTILIASRAAWRSVRGSGVAGAACPARRRARQPAAVGSTLSLAGRLRAL